MGQNESSQRLKGLEISKKAIEATDHYRLYTAQMLSGGPHRHISIFQSDVGQFDSETNFDLGKQSPLERATRNLKIYRHPNILRYIASWTRGTSKFLATERVRPLSAVLATQSDVQLCLGLKSILCALVFLVEHAKTRHLNVSVGSIYVSEEGGWRLFGFDHLWKVGEVSEAVLDKSRVFRHQTAVDPEEAKGKLVGLEQFAFGVLCEDVLKSRKEDNIPHVEEFKAYCASHLKNPVATMRPTLQALLLHPYFNHDFIVIHSFLTELPLKDTGARGEFFASLVDRLRVFDEESVAGQLSGLLLSRMVLLDATAQQALVPFVLRPKSEEFDAGLFSAATFGRFVTGKLKEVFCVRDLQIRLILLEYFPHYVETFSREDLKDDILPQLLLGIKDTSDYLVSRTLLCLADLVPILGAATVIGGNRSRIFVDGRPQGPPPDIDPIKWSEPRSITPVITSAELLSGSPVPDHVDISSSYTLDPNEVNYKSMPERPSPDGEEIPTASEVELESEWSDWEGEEGKKDSSTIIVEPLPKMEAPVVPPVIRSGPIEDLDELDIKIQPIKSRERGSAEHEFDFFKDMEPVIQSASVILPSTTTAAEEQATTSSRLGVKPDSIDDEAGWDAEETGWGDDE